MIVRPHWMSGMLLVVGLSASLSGTVTAQRNSGGGEGCEGQNWGDDRSGFCEVREYTVPATGALLSVDAAPNGGIVVEGSPRQDILVRARVIATAKTEEEAKALAARVQVTATADRVVAEGPRGLGLQGWHVSYRLAVPPSTPVSLKTTNGGISVDGMDSRVEFTTVNGGVKLSRMAGDVEGRTSNGGVDVDLDGSTWQGTGLDVQTTNGGVRLRIPANYSAHLETGTVNGGVNIDYPMTTQERSGRSISADIGGGGPTLRVSTSNGGVRVTRK